jgi:hypothetical protein
MLQTMKCRQKYALFTAIGTFIFFAANLHIAQAAESGCITCHLDQEMLKKNITIKEGLKSTMQSGAG